jgi:Flp pilus assembly pilin Flp
MNSISKKVRKLLSDTRGANLVEYIILVGVVALLCIGGFSAFGDKVKSKISAQAKTVSSIEDTAGAAAP